MSQSNHTPGPWSYGKFAEFIYSNRDDNPLFVAEVVADIDNPQSIEEMEANAALIASCPDMLSALELMAEQFGHYCEHTEDPSEIDALLKARAAIAKAKGGAS